MLSSVADPCLSLPRGWLGGWHTDGSAALALPPPRPSIVTALPCYVAAPLPCPGLPPPTDLLALPLVLLLLLLPLLLLLLPLLAPALAAERE